MGNNEIGNSNIGFLGGVNTQLGLTLAPGFKPAIDAEPSIDLINLSGPLGKITLGASHKTDLSFLGLTDTTYSGTSGFIRTIQRSGYWDLGLQIKLPITSHTSITQNRKKSFDPDHCKEIEDQGGICDSSAAVINQEDDNSPSIKNVNTANAQIEVGFNAANFRIFFYANAGAELGALWNALNNTGDKAELSSGAGLGLTVFFDSPASLSIDADTADLLQNELGFLILGSGSILSTLIANQNSEYDEHSQNADESRIAAPGEQEEGIKDLNLATHLQSEFFRAAAFISARQAMLSLPENQSTGWDIGHGLALSGLGYYLSKVEDSDKTNSGILYPILLGSGLGFLDRNFEEATPYARLGLSAATLFTEKDLALSAQAYAVAGCFEKNDLNCHLGLGLGAVHIISNAYDGDSTGAIMSSAALGIGLLGALLWNHKGEDSESGVSPYADLDQNGGTTGIQGRW